MEIYIIDAFVFDDMIAKIGLLESKFKKLTINGSDMSIKKWMDNQDVCIFLRIKPRTLQALRNNGTLAYTQFGRKLFYLVDDVQRLIQCKGIGEFD